MTMFNLEKLVKTPIIPDGRTYLAPNGCGCAKGIAYVASHDNVDWRRTFIGFAAVDNYKVKDWVDSLNPELITVLSAAENALFRINALNAYANAELINEIYPSSILGLETPEEVKKWMIDELVKLGVTDATPAKEEVNCIR